ncbi:MAG: hypothetical protein RLZZ330_935 [Actinomycetota bacterium]|jgi:hypothetical protein
MTKTKSVHCPTPNQIAFPCHAKIEGPKTLFQKIHSYLPELAAPDFLYAWLDAEDVLVGLEHFEVDEDELEELCIKTPAACGNRQKLVVICRAELKETAKSIAQKIEFSAPEPLDVLVCTSTRWWSHICTNEDCCPKVGRLINEQDCRPKQSEAIIQNRHQVWLNWLQVIEQNLDADRSVKINDDLETALRESLSDLAIRDCVLSHVATVGEKQTSWRRVIEHLLTNGNTENNHILYCFLAAISMTENDRARADFFTKQALLINPEYSLSVLLQHGLEMKMATPRIVSAFTHFTIEDLIERTPERKGAKR